MLGIFKSSINLAKSPINLLRPSSQVLSQNNINDGLTSNNGACQQCNVVGSNNRNQSCSQPFPGFLGAFRTFTSFSGFSFARNAQFSNVGLATGWENSMMTPAVGGPFNMQVRGMKIKAKAKRRCKDCYLQWINGVLHNLCDARPRHKHKQKPPYYSNQRFLTHATMHPKRPY